MAVTATEAVEHMPPSESFAIDVQLQARDSERLLARLRRTELLNRRWAATLLLVGTVTGFLAFVLATGAGTFNSMVGYELEKSCWTDRPYQACPSGRSYHAETVSEMVSKAGTPSSKLFYAFTIIASVCLLISRYPWEFRNVYTHNDGCPVSWMSVPGIRAVVPPLGMLIVAQVPVVPRVMRTTRAITLSCNVHTGGAVLFVAGYNFLEAYALWVLWLKLARTERQLRCVCAAASTACMIGFVLCGWLYNSTTWFCCQDAYEDSLKLFNETFGPYQSEDIVFRTYGRMSLVNSASGSGLLVKKIEFWAEELAGLFIIASHMIIWYFSDCRDVRVPNLSSTFNVDRV